MFVLIGLLAASAVPVSASKEPDRYQILTVYGGDPCPRSSAEEVVVCARMPESERYRIPKKLREKRSASGPASVAWNQKVQALEYVSRIGTPNSCSPVGSGGATGCFQKFMREARDQRAADEAEKAGEF